MKMYRYPVYNVVSNLLFMNSIYCKSDIIGQLSRYKSEWIPIGINAFFSRKYNRNLGNN